MLARELNSLFSGGGSSITIARTAALYNAFSVQLFNCTWKKLPIRPLFVKKYNRSSRVAFHKIVLFLRYKYIFTDHVIRRIRRMLLLRRIFVFSKFSKILHTLTRVILIKDFSCDIISGNSVVVSFR